MAALPSATRPWHIRTHGARRLNDGAPREHADVSRGVRDLRGPRQKESSQWRPRCGLPQCDPRGDIQGLQKRGWPPVAATAEPITRANTRALPHTGHNHWEVGIGMNYRRGLVRLWIVGTAAWTAIAGWESGLVHKIDYASRYHFNRSSLETTGLAKKSCEYGLALWSTHNPKTETEREPEAFSAEARAADERVERRTGVKLPPLTMDLPAQNFDVRACVENYKASAPDWSWLAWLLLPPVLGPATLWLAFLISRWILLGFRTR